LKILFSQNKNFILFTGYKSSKNTPRNDMIIYIEKDINIQDLYNLYIINYEEYDDIVIKKNSFELLIIIKIIKYFYFIYPDETFFKDRNTYINNLNNIYSNEYEIQNIKIQDKIEKLKKDNSDYNKNNENIKTMHENLMNKDLLDDILNKI